jgi:hypothetical protein
MEIAIVAFIMAAIAVAFGHLTYKIIELIE